VKKYVLHEDRSCQWVMLGRDPERNEAVIDTNEYLIICGDEAILLDPGGSEIFPSVLTAVSDAVEIERITAYLCSHQDPDIMSSLPLWLGLTPEAKIYMSWLWSDFVAHFGSEYSPNFVTVPDEGQTIKVGDRSLQLVPAHYLHSAGNFHLYDQAAGVMFTGDVGSALLPEGYPIFVEDFDAHVRYMEKFHVRWMSSNAAKDDWIRRVRKMAPKMLCPQHGAIFKDENVEKFLDWFERLEVGKTKRVA
jgi:flavorubredoxin